MNTYVRVCGNMRSLDQKRSMMAFRIKVIRDFNEVTYHNLQCIFQHLHLTRGAAPPGSGPQAASVPGFGGRPGGAAAAGAGGFGGAPAGGADGASKLHLDVMAVYNSVGAGRDNGLSMTESLSELQRRGLPYTIQQVGFG